MLLHGMKMNDHTTEFILLGTIKQLSRVNFGSNWVGGVEVRKVDDVKTLGVCFQCSLNFEKHITLKIRAAIHNVYNISKLLEFLFKAFV